MAAKSIPPTRCRRVDFPDPAARPKVRATVNDVTLRTTVSVYGGRSYVGFRKEIQEAAGIRIGDRIRVRIEPDLEPREIEVPEDLARALGEN